MWSEAVCGGRRCVEGGRVWSETATFTYPVVCQLLVEALADVELHSLPPYVS